MTRPISLDRLRDISKPRRIRKPVPVAAGDDWNERQPEVPPERVEWPVLL